MMLFSDFMILFSDLIIFTVFNFCDARCFCMFLLGSLVSPEITSTDLTIPSFHTYAIDQNLLESIDFQLRASLDQGGLAEAELG